MDYGRISKLTKSSDSVGLFSAKRAFLAAVCGAIAGGSVYNAANSPILAAIGIAAAIMFAVFGLGAALARLAGTVAALHTQVSGLFSSRQIDSAALANLKSTLDEISSSVRLSDKRLTDVESRQSAMPAEIDARQVARQQMLDDAYLTLRADAARLIELQALIQSRMESLEKRILQKLEHLVDAQDARSAEDIQNLHIELLQRQDLILDMTTALRVELASAKDRANGERPAESSESG